MPEETLDMAEIGVRLGEIEKTQQSLMLGQANIEGRLGELTRSWEDLRKHFMGNGQPGVCAVHATEIEALKLWQTAAASKVDKASKIDELESWKKVTNGQLKVLKWILAIVVIPAVLSAWSSIKDGVLFSRAPQPTAITHSAP